MKQEEMQMNSVDSPEMAQPEGGMTPEDAKASLGLATRFGEQMLMSMAPPQQEEEAPQEQKLSEQYPEAESEDNDKIDMVLEEIQGIKEEIKQLMEDNEEENGEE